MKILTLTGHTSVCNLEKYNYTTYQVEDKCEFKGTPTEVWEHVNHNCDYMFTKCSYDKCKVFGQRWYIKTHELNCPYNLILCNHCGRKFTPNTMKTHYIRIMEKFSHGIFQEIHYMKIFMQNYDNKYLTKQEYLVENIDNLSALFNNCTTNLQKKLRHDVPFQFTESEANLFS